jgi:hypothetical protein
VIVGQAGFAGDVGIQRGQLGTGVFQPLGDLLFFQRQFIARPDDATKRGAGFGGLCAGIGHACGGAGLRSGGGKLRLIGLLQQVFGIAQCLGCFIGCLVGRSPFEREHAGFGGAGLGGNFSKTGRLARLAAQHIQLAIQFPDHIIEALNVGFGGPQT